MSTISVEEIARDPAGFVRRLAAGESMLLVSDDRAIAEVTPVVPATAKGPRPFGLAAGEFTVPDDFDAPLPESIIKDFEGR